jgi:hypothetical protein
MLSKDFIELYKTEGLAEEAFKELRFKMGISCKKCGGNQHYWLRSKSQFQCKSCRFRTTLKSGTVLEGSKLPCSYFFIAVHLLMKHGYNLSLDEFQKYTGHKYHDPLWDFLKKIKDYTKETEQNSLFINFMEVVNQCFVNRKEVTSIRLMV